MINVAIVIVIRLKENMTVLIHTPNVVRTNLTQTEVRH